MKKINFVLLLVILSLSLISSPVAMFAQNDEIVATVNGVAITSAQFYEVLETQYGQYALQELIQNEMIRQKAETLGVTLDEEAFAEMYDMVLAQVGGAQGLQMFLMQNNVTEETFIEQLKWNMLIGDLARSEVEVAEGEVEQFFEENRSYYDEQETVEVSHILVETEEEANEVLGLLQEGGDLVSLASDYSLDPGTASQGGYLGVIPRGYTAESNFGWHVITVHAINEAKAAIFAEIVDLVEKDFRGSKALDLQSYMYKLEQETDIQVEWQK